MSISFKCPVCGTATKQPDSMAGQKSVCMYCNKHVWVPSVSGGPSTALTIEEIEGKPAKQPVLAKLVKTNKDDQAKEPWFYVCLEFCALLGTALGILAGVVSTFAAFSVRADPIVIVLTAFIYFAGAMFSGGTILLLVDIGRSLRKNRP